MTVLDAAKNLYEAGRFIEALRTLDDGRLIHDERTGGSILRAMLLLQIGRIGEAGFLAADLLRSELSLVQKSCAEWVLGKVSRENRDHQLAIEHFNRSILLARQANSLSELCRAQLSLMLLVCDSNGPDAASPLLAEIRANVIKLGDARTTAALHVFVGEAEAKRGLLRSARRHAALALELLRAAPNLWLESIAENLIMGIALEEANLDAGLKRGLHALDLADEAGNAAMRRSCLGNLGNLYYARGEFDRALDYFERSYKALPSGAQAVSCLTNLARVRLSQGRINDAAKLMTEIDDATASDHNRNSYPYRYAALARSVVLFRQNRVEDAHKELESVLGICDQMGDEMLKHKALMAQAEFFLASGRHSDFTKALNAALAQLHDESPQFYVQFERILCLATAGNGDGKVARQHFDRAQRISEVCQLVVPEFDIRARDDDGDKQPNNVVTPVVEPDARTMSTAGSVIQSITAITANLSRPELVGRELLAIVESAGFAHSAVVTARTEQGSRVVAAVGQELGNSYSSKHQLKIGESDGRTIELTLLPKNEPEATASANALMRLVATLQELQRARIDREERAMLWPSEDLPVDNEHAVVTGHMRELMGVVQRIARAPIGVLISGESGTGKEIIARAIHDYSDRARKAFVPVNCAAVPRELMESQLFGHRRGAFTGADRDYPGLIRTAHEGTLFFDEIGELSLDLQPKLLRFLESGEIAPLGAAAPVTVSVRVLAATNKNLEELVRAGKFREDLFYRLNVVPLVIRPLRERRDEIPALVQHFVDRAAREFKKGHLTVAEETMERLLLYRWPGNVRQLQHELQRIVALVEPDSTLLPDMIAEDILGALPLLRPIPNPREMAVSLNDKLPSAIARIESEMIKLALHDNRGKVDATAKALGISRKGLYLKRQRLGL